MSWKQAWWDVKAGRLLQVYRLTNPKSTSRVRQKQGQISGTQVYPRLGRAKRGREKCKQNKIKDRESNTRYWLASDSIHKQRITNTKGNGGNLNRVMVKRHKQLKVR